MKNTKDNVKANKPKQKYKIKNWGEYNRALIKRGSLTLWISGDIREWWYGNGKNTYSDKAIEFMLILKAEYRLPLRAVVGFVRSIFQMADINLNIPDYSTLSRRAGKLKINLQKQNKGKVSINLDSSGLKVYGEGEWKVRQHGWSKRRTWTKIHIGIDDDGEIRAEITTENNVHDSEVIDECLNQEEAEIDTFRGDGAYDAGPVYMSLSGRNVSNVCIPPRKYARIRIHGNDHAPPYTRDENIRAIRKTSRKRWKVESGYHRRSLVENTMFRWKTIFGDHLSFRSKENQRTEVMVKSNILNTFHRLGMPESYAVASP